ncbi:uncharacterized protein LOC128219773 [Mya arenaria]|uniref:uncharacterized protein LOC128219773 n=1 Tax=Mya arenaria TaxID=6604 RepID=UPI0022E80924|nr:uncharacterized protein LOC128219773 [Mya arenaria]
MDGQANMLELDTETDTDLQELDFGEIRQQRFDRNKHFLETVDPGAAAKVFPRTEAEIAEDSFLNHEEYAAIHIQRHWRGFKGRQIYVNKLFEKYEKDEEQQHRRVVQQMEEGDLLVENHQLEVLLEDGVTVRRNAKRRLIFHVIQIQRAWRSYLERKHSKGQGHSAAGNHGNNPNCIPATAVNSNNEKDTDDQQSDNDEGFMFNPLLDNTVCESGWVLSENSSRESFDNVIGNKDLSGRNKCQGNEDLSPTQQRKRHFLLQAHQFAELKKQNSNVLPFNLHIHLNQAESITYDIDHSRMTTMAPENEKLVLPEHCGPSQEKNLLDFENSTVNANGVERTKGSNSNPENVCDKSKGGNYNSYKCEKCSKGEDCDTCDEERPFDVYNIETAMPNMDWKTLEAKLRIASEQAKLIQEARRNDREEIRKKLAFGGEDDSYDDNEDEEAGFSKPRLQSRLHSGLQICFMNESPGDTDNEGVSPRQPDIHDNARLMAKVSNLVDSDNNLSTVEDLNQSSTPPTTATQSCSPPRLKAGDLPSPADDFHSRQERLQNEAKLALAQAGSMAHMQLEIEKQTKKKSPIAEMAGIPGLGERRRKKLAPRQLQQMNLAQTQVLYNDLQTQIESLNEDLVRLLMERDELHMEQDSMLVDIEDLTRHAEELADRANRQANAKSTSSKGKMPAR